MTVSGAACDMRGVNSRIVAAISPISSTAGLDIGWKQIQMYDGALIAFIPDGWPVFDGVVPNRDHQVSRGEDLVPG
jgi:hypothetical protein